MALRVASRSGRSVPLTEAPAVMGPIHDQELYFEGDLVILALGPQPTLFRVLRTTLTTYSTVFSDMFSLPSGSDEIDSTAEGRTDENPIYLPDDPKTFRTMLGLYHGGIAKREPPTPDFNTAVEVLRLSTKYEFQHAREWALKHLRTTWSRTSSTWLDYLCNPTAELTRDALTLLDAARSTNAPEFIPVVFCFLCMLDDLRGISSGNTTLSRDDLLKLWLGSQYLLEAWGVRCYRSVDRPVASGWGNHLGTVPSHKWNELVRSTETIGSLCSAMGFFTSSEGEEREMTLGPFSNRGFSRFKFYLAQDCISLKIEAPRSEIDREVEVKYQ
ncbi:hypothetical protein BOTBODRAFT_66033 [Botryobasidium botryosum FD-172 SS1]|uniref:BTB domain-containing protein n=1 Tax=Botryobasidium botryosum (strain FD-172 SS1) TaxID=930990 RepID=A0A067MI95_BOTB1|nr:hypothetical protein BOTBODRAFT_66033 [Botryobasidium botryosum FD-172 SS1]